MDEESTLESVDNDAAVVAIAKMHLGSDPRVTFSVQDGSAFLKACEGKYDLIFADTWPGKYWDLHLALALLGPGGIYIVDDMLPQEGWPEDHPPKVRKLIQTLEALEGYHVVKMCWSTGIILVTKA
jgi:predicted O-methyltransferase YrrM